MPNARQSSDPRGFSKARAAQSVRAELDRERQAASARSQREHAVPSGVSAKKKRGSTSSLNARKDDRHARNNKSADRDKARSKTGSARSATRAKQQRESGPIALFAAVFIVLLGTIQLVATFHSYAQNLSELNGLKRQEASLQSQKRGLENDIARWDDKAYVTAQARERLGFVFPGEQAVHVEHPEAVTGVKPKKGGSATAVSKPLPWYSEMSYSFKKADAPLPKRDDDTGVVSGSAQDKTHPKSDAGNGADNNGTDDKSSKK